MKRIKVTKAIYVEGKAVKPDGPTKGIVEVDDKTASHLIAQGVAAEIPGEETPKKEAAKNKTSK